MSKDWGDFRCGDCKAARENGKGSIFCKKHQDDFIFKLFNPMQEAIDEIKGILDKRIEDGDLNKSWIEKKRERENFLNKIKKVEGKYANKGRGVSEVGSSADG